MFRGRHERDDLSERGGNAVTCSEGLCRAQGRIRPAVEDENDNAGGCRYSEQHGGDSYPEAFPRECVTHETFALPKREMGGAAGFIFSPFLLRYCTATAGGFIFGVGGGFCLGGGGG